MSTTFHDETTGESHFAGEAHDQQAALAAICERCRLSWADRPDCAKISNVLITHRAADDGWNIRIDAWYEGTHQVYLASTISW